MKTASIIVRKMVLPVAVSALLLGACATEEGPEEEVVEQPAGTEDQTLAVTAIDYAFEGIPATFAAGSTIELQNSSTEEAHELVAFRLPADESRSAAELFQLPQAELEPILGGSGGPPATVIVAAPSEGGMAVVGDGSISEPGRYVFACFIPTGADPDEFLAAAEASGDEPPDVEGGPPHFVEGMFAEATVE